MIKEKLKRFFLKFKHVPEEKGEWELTEYVWNLGIAQACTRGLDKNPFTFFRSPLPIKKEMYKQIQDKDLVWLHCADFPFFYKQVFPEIRHRFTLIINDGDDYFPSECGIKIDIEKFINDERIIHIYAQNCDYIGPSNKVSHIPIGIDFHSIAYKRGTFWGETGSPLQQEATLKRILEELPPTHLRKKRAYIDFHLSDTMKKRRYKQFGENRTTIFKRVLQTGLIDYAQRRMKRSDLWKIKGQYAFSISPPGNAVDCHRTWEDLVLGCIVIVKTSSLDPMFEGLPVVIVKDWSEITDETLDKWLVQYGDAFTNSSYRYKLTNKYWIDKIESSKM